jgi:hypothetical protein
MATTTIKDGFNGGSDNQLKVNSDGSINVDIGGSAGSNVNLVSVGGSAITLGQNTSANSLPVVIASDQSPVNVEIAGVNPSQNSVLVYTQQTAVAVGVTTTVATYTAPASPKVACLLLISVSGTNVAQWTITNSASGTYDENYTSAAQLNEVFSFETGSSVVPGQIIGAGNTITVSVNQIGTSAGNFGARIQVLEIG